MTYFLHAYLVLREEEASHVVGGGECTCNEGRSTTQEKENCSTLRKEGGCAPWSSFISKLRVLFPSSFFQEVQLGLQLGKAKVVRDFCATNHQSLNEPTHH